MKTKPKFEVNDLVHVVGMHDEVLRDTTYSIVKIEGTGCLIRQIGTVDGRFYRAQPWDVSMLVLHVEKPKKPKAETRTIYKLTFFSFNPAVPSETREIECRDLAEAIKVKDMLAKGRPYFELTPITTVTR